MIDMEIEPFKPGRKQIKSVTDLISLHVADLQEVGKFLPVPDLQFQRILANENCIVTQQANVVFHSTTR